MKRDDIEADGYVAEYDGYRQYESKAEAETVGRSVPWVIRAKIFTAE